MTDLRAGESVAIRATVVTERVNGHVLVDPDGRWGVAPTPTGVALEVMDASMIVRPVARDVRTVIDAMRVRAAELETTGWSIRASDLSGWADQLEAVMSGE